MRLDRFLLTQESLAGLGRRRLAELLGSGAVRVNGARARKGTIVCTGDTITFAAAMSPSALAPSPPLAVLYADDDLLALDKPPGLPTTVGRKPGANLAAALLARHPEMAAFGDDRHAGLVHRLDTGTSGLVLAARHAEAHERLRAAFTGKSLDKEYLAVVTGHLAAPVVVATPLARLPHKRNRMVVARDGEGWPARTEVTPIDGDETLTVVRLRMRTGVTHQLRVHLASTGHPIVNDARYAGLTGHVADVPAADWHYLHARTVTFDDPTLPRGIATPFPAHWRPLFAARGWSLPPET